MRIPNSFKTKIKDTFYDKAVIVLDKTSSVDDEGWAGEESTTEVGTILGNVRFDRLAEVQEEYGIDEQVDFTMTTDEDVDTGTIVEYEGIEYRVINSVPYDSHNLVIGTKWTSKSTTLGSA